MTRIEVLGPDGPLGEALLARVRTAVAASGRPAEIVAVRDMDLITSYGVMATPALVIADRVRAVGRLPSEDEIRAWLP